MGYIAKAVINNIFKELMMKKKLAIVSLIVLSVFSLFIAGCSKKTEKYTVTFDSDGGTEIASVQVEKGKKITKPEDPSKEHYVFGGWYLEDTEWVFESDTVTKNTALTAKWTPEVYSVTLKNYDGTVLATENVSYGSLPQYSATPEKPSDAQYTYAFSKWVDEAGNDASLSNIDKNVTLTATFTSTLRSYKIIFKNGDTVLKEDDVNYGTLPAAPTETPTKEADAQYTYTFKGWDKEIAEVKGEATYNAEFDSTLRSYKIIFKNGEQVLKEETVNYGTLPTPPADMPTKEADAQYTYTFKGWDKTVENVTGEATYNAEFNSTLRSYKITFKNGEQVLKEETVNYGTLPAAPTETPTKEADAQYTYTFKGWDKEIAEVTGEATYNAEFTPTLRSYKITFKNGEQVLKEETVDYGTMPAAPETNPTKGYDSENHYSFKGWDKTIEKVTGEAVYNAQFNVEKHGYTVDDSDETTDYIVCSCGYKDETYAYDKRVTSNRKELPVDGTGLSLTVEGATFASVEKMTINGVDVSGEITSFVIPDAVKSDKERHGLQDVILTVKDELGYSHTLKVPVTLITKEIATLGDLNAALTADDKTDIWYTIYGYYNFNYCEISEDCDKIVLDDFPVKVKKLVSGIDKSSRDRFDAYKDAYNLPELMPDRTLRDFGYMFELKAGKGRLLVCGFNLTGIDENEPSATATARFIKNYINSDDFNPENEIPLEELKAYAKRCAKEPVRERTMTQFWELDDAPVESPEFWREAKEYLK